MILTADVGNSNIVLAIFDNDEIIKQWRIVTVKDKSKDEYQMVIEQLMDIAKIDIKKIEGIVISSVVPELNFVLPEALSFITNKILVLGDNGVKTNVKIKSVNERKIGSDIIANIVAGKSYCKENFIIVDMGTATTFDIAVQNGDYAGSIILTGANLCVDALHKAASQLPLIEVKKPNQYLGNTTIDMMKSGIYYGYIGAIKEIISQIKNTFPDIQFKIFLTGGVSKVFVHDLQFVDAVLPDLTSVGLNEIWKINKK